MHRLKNIWYLKIQRNAALKQRLHISAVELCIQDWVLYLRENLRSPKDYKLPLINPHGSHQRWHRPA